MMDNLTIEEDHKLWILFYQTRDAIFKARQKELSRFGITPMQAAVLLRLEVIGSEATPAEVARWLFRKPHSVSGILDRMVKQGLIEKAKDLERKNLVRITITPKGKQAFSESTKRKSIHEIMASLSDEERRVLKSCLEKMRSAALKAAGLKPSLPFPR
jgi:DNA-binding MarR family transcriptional regulator